MKCVCENEEFIITKWSDVTSYTKKKKSCVQFYKHPHIHVYHLDSQYKWIPCVRLMILTKTTTALKSYEKY